MTFAHDRYNTLETRGSGLRELYGTVIFLQKQEKLQRYKISKLRLLVIQQKQSHMREKENDER